MNKDIQHFQNLVSAYLADNITAAEGAELAHLLQLTKYQERLKELIYAQLNRKELDMDFPSVESLQRNQQFIIERIKQQAAKAPGYTGSSTIRLHFQRRWWVAAASVLLLAAVGGYFWKNSYRQADIRASEPIAIQAGKNGAILTLEDGSQVSLDSVKNATVALQGGVTAKVMNGTLVYEGKSDVVAYNTMTTPKGRQFRLTLPDGTGVWLNAASSIRYPTTFTGNKRLVEITGEAYFEVAKNAAKPFMVNVAGKAKVDVLGTSFNVNAYENENTIQTTLLEGSIGIITSRAQLTLKPGQQAQIDPTSANREIKVMDNVDLDKAVAWRNGVFNFNNISFAAAMRQLERWYDIEVVYEKDIPDNIELNGKIPKHITLNDVLAALQEVGVKCRLEGRKLVIFK